MDIIVTVHCLNSFKYFLNILVSALRQSINPLVLLTWWAKKTKLLFNSVII